MAIPCDGAIALRGNIVAEYGGSGQDSISEYYRGGAYVPNHDNTQTIPTSSTISWSDFKCSDKDAPVVPPTNKYVQIGYSVNSRVDGQLVFGSPQALFNHTYTGNSVSMNQSVPVPSYVGTEVRWNSLTFWYRTTTLGWTPTGNWEVTALYFSTGPRIWVYNSYSGGDPPGEYEWISDWFSVSGSAITFVPYMWVKHSSVTRTYVRVYGTMRGLP